MKRVNRLFAVGVLAFAALVALPGTAGGAGITTHRWMAEEAVDQVTEPQLATLLTENMAMLQTGAGFPDVGYVGDNTYGETAHWQRFVDNLVDATRARPDCDDLTDPDGPCAPLVAFIMGIAAHGMGDQVWDWLFEPNSPDRGEYWTGVATATDTGAETQMDIVAIGQYGVARPAAGTVPDEPLVLQAFTDSGQGGVDASQFALVGLLPVLWDAEKGWSDEYLTDVHAAMPWMSDNMVTAPGGVDFAATAIAGYWSTVWGRLLGHQPATRVSITYPAPGETDVPATGWNRASFQPGSAPGRGGARNRITAALTSARPYTGAAGGLPVSDAMEPGTMTITNLATGEPVPLKAGYPRSVPYGSDAGEHLIDTQPAENLEECTWYRVDVSTGTPLLDAEAKPVTPYSWQFRTECDEEPEGTTTTVPGAGTTTVPTPSPTTAPAPTVTAPNPPSSTVPTTGAPIPSTVPATGPSTAPATSSTTTPPERVDTAPADTAPGNRPGSGQSPPAATAVTRTPDYTG